MRHANLLTTLLGLGLIGCLGIPAAEDSMAMFRPYYPKPQSSTIPVDMPVALPKSIPVVEPKAPPQLEPLPEYYVIPKIQTDCTKG